jgi:acyl-CoA hydrolase
VQVGDVLSIYAQQKRMGTSSLTIALQGVVERKGEDFEAVSAEFVFVTVDANHKSEPIQAKTKSSECRSCAS